jgi:hypothetical protein
VRYKFYIGPEKFHLPSLGLFARRPVEKCRILPWGRDFLAGPAMLQSGQCRIDRGRVRSQVVDPSPRRAAFDPDQIRWRAARARDDATVLI